MPSMNLLFLSLTCLSIWLSLFAPSSSDALLDSHYAAFSNVSQDLQSLQPQAACALISHLCQPNIMPFHSLGITARDAVMSWFHNQHAKMLGTAVLQVKGIRATFSYQEHCVRLPTTLVKEAALKEPIGVRSHATIVCHQFAMVACRVYQNKTTQWDTSQAFHYYHSLNFCVVCSAFVLSSPILIFMYKFI
ncbi:ORF4b protein [Simian hemorrhagic encephalitis virus]|uniref:ORF4b protein n=1 Tax=Simian hemorrhagic encephalitis virus TaxID=1965068 RepID=A0A0F6PU05_9NIDO|nr:ORF4b protein [Simian hemorrhagic encephalitis virus]AKC89297.1 ORF4b protein [Simian hemorrhagic encephalitis virus]